MTLSELRTLTSFWLQDTENGYFTTAILDVFINNAQRELQKLLLQAGESYYTICVETSTVANQRDYALPSDFLQLDLLERITQGSDDTAATERLYPLERSEIEVAGYNARATNQGLPYNYVLNKSTFSLYPVPDSVKTLRLWYSPRVTDMSNDADTPDAPEDYHEFIAILAARDGFLSDNRSLAPIESKLAYYEKMLEEQSESRNSDSPRMVIATSTGFGSF